MITYEEVRCLFKYYPKTGNLRWRIDRGKKKAGQLAGNHFSYGHLAIKTGGHSYLVHRLIWLYVYGEWPNGELDHEDQDPSNNRIGNLRDVTPVQNSKNKRIYTNNSSGASGVTWDNKRERWRVRCFHKGKTIHLGFYKSRKKAIRVRKAAESEHGYHANHGKVK